MLLKFESWSFLGPFKGRIKFSPDAFVFTTTFESRNKNLAKFFRKAYRLD